MPGGKGNIRPEDGVPFSKENQPANRGRKKGVRMWGLVFEDVIPDDGLLSLENVMEVDGDGNPTGQVFKRAKVKMPTQEMLALAAIRKAMKGDMRALEMIMNRMDGKPPQQINHAGNEGQPVEMHQWVIKVKEAPEDD